MIKIFSVAIALLSGIFLFSQAKAQDAAVPTSADVLCFISPEKPDSVQVSFKLKFRHHPKLKYLSVRVGAKEGEGELLSEDMEYTGNRKLFKSAEEISVANDGHIYLQKISARPVKQEMTAQINGYDAEMNLIYTIVKKIKL